MSRILLVDVDSTIPNLALMKLSSWHKGQGDQVGFDITDPDKIYASVVFKKNAHKLDGLKFFYPGAEIIVGGSGIDLKATLPDEVEYIRPDYDLYPGMDYSLGFTSRGCIRNCYFCIVPRKEGKITRWQHPSEFVIQVKILDNNWYADPEWFFETSQWFIDHKIAVDITQGMDIRLITPEIAGQLKKLTVYPKMHFAFDDRSYAESVKSGIEILKAANINVRSDVLFFVYCHNDDQVDDAAARAEQLREWGVQAMIMNNIDRPRSPRMKNLYRWAMPQIYWTGVPFKDYDANKKKTAVRKPGDAHQ